MSDGSLSPSNPERVGLLRRLRYRFGFYVHRDAESPRHRLDCLVDADWTTRLVGGFKLWTHPQTRCLPVEAGAFQYVILGDAFADSTQADFSPSELGDEIFRLPPGDDDALHAFAAGLGGRFALLVVDGDRLRVFHDPVGSRSVFYRTNGPLAVASHVELLARATEAPPSSEMADYVADPGYVTRRVKYLPGDLTLYRDILALPPNLLYDSDLGGVRRFWPRAPLAPASEESFRETARRSFANFAACLAARYNVVLGLTGGVDCRLALALLQAGGLDLTGATWSFGLLPGETTIIDTLVARAGLAHRYVTPLREPGQLGRLARHNDGRALTRTPTLCPTLRRTFRDIPDVALVRGWGGEIMRGYYNLKLDPMRSAEASEMTRVYLAAPAHGRKGEKIRPGERFRASTEASFAAFAARGGYADLPRYGYDPNDIFYWEHRVGMWCAAEVNQTDAALPNFVAFNSRRTYDAAFGLPATRRLTKQLFLDLAAAIDPRYAAAPITNPDDTLRARLRRIGQFLPRWR